MELDRNEHSILGFFPSSTMAQKAMEALKKAKLVPNEGSIQIDRISRFGVVNDSEYNNPINNAITLHGPTIYSNSAGVDDGANPLLAANDTENGRGINNDNLAGEENFMLTLVTSKDNIEKAVAIMKANGGRV
ncbi:MAG: hypothetical protein CVU90_13125 [Firmicutes bacterium HGW-Firmicutes-15]|nr:MAG: hypothetical protein CVU90_13125 [Firmicutes bacterium HGW-Firmicutes-15]